MIILSGYGGTAQQSGILHENPTILFTHAGIPVRRDIFFMLTQQGVLFRMKTFEKNGFKRCFCNGEEEKKKL